jgi:hypothetical protein
LLAQSSVTVATVVDVRLNPGACRRNDHQVTAFSRVRTLPEREFVGMTVDDLP